MADDRKIRPELDPSVIELLHNAAPESAIGRARTCGIDVAALAIRLARDDRRYPRWSREKTMSAATAKFHLREDLPIAALDRVLTKLG